MCCSSQSFPGVKLAKTLLTVGFVFTNLVVFSQRAAADPSASATVPASPEGLGATIFWVGAAIFACVTAAGAVILARKLHQQKALVAAGAMPAPESQKPFSLPNGNGNGSRSLKLNNRPAKSSKASNNGNGNNTRRRRMFNYHKFYTEMVLQGPAPTSMAESSYNPYNGYNGYYVEYDQPHLNHNGNGHSNGHGHNGNHNGHENHVAQSSADSHAAVGAQTALLANQKSLIEEQQRLIHEQARLIEEKSRLIAEKNQLLDRQSQMLDNNLL